MIADKVKNPAALKRILSALKKKGKRIAFTNGCFDILHYGHAKYLEDAKKLADILIVAVNDDSSVRRLKGAKRPLFLLGDRMKVLAALESVDFVTFFKEDTPAEIITLLKPDLVIKGGDYAVKEIVGNDIVSSYGGRVRRVKFQAGYSVSSLIKKILTRYSV